ncbi:hypothetical protein F2Q70_00005387 [Brassica cretica]|uniref:Uncharacterized protein n=1 Tax=Brassica cretica TaxID=69181 RepID=A0A8S9IPX4_BRACR|nr:hypothetical protein F2Q70_00005387 [Brassica cretica]KAF3562797.1 hypothetical protein DY000_02017724 [Brassica cretica]
MKKLNLKSAAILEPSSSKTAAPPGYIYPFRSIVGTKRIQRLLDDGDERKGPMTLALSSLPLPLKFLVPPRSYYTLLRSSLREMMMKKVVIKYLVYY